MKGLNREFFVGDFASSVVTMVKKEKQEADIDLTQRLFASKRKYKHNSTTLNGRLPERPNFLSLSKLATQ